MDAQALAELTDLTWAAESGSARVELQPADDGTATVRVCGELDLATAPLVERAVQSLHVSGRHQVHLDLGAVSFCDCAGLHALIASDRMLRAAGGQLTFGSLSAPVRRLLSLTNCTESAPSTDLRTNSRDEFRLLPASVEHFVYGSGRPWPLTHTCQSMHPDRGRQVPDATRASV